MLAPAITGIPELVRNETAGFLYQTDNMHDFIRQIERILSGSVDLKTVTESARRHVTEHFNREKNLRTFAEGFLPRINARHSTVKDEAASHAHTLLQQI